MSNAFDATAINYRVGSVATNAVKSIREVYGRDHLPFLDADSAAIKAIESVLMSVPVFSEYAELEAKPIVASNQPAAHPALAQVGNMLSGEAPVAIESSPTPARIKRNS